MSLDQAEIVDLVTESPSGEIALVMSDTDTWDGSPERVLQLQTKLNTYYEFIRSGQLYELHPAAKGRPLRIQLDTLEPLDPTTQRLAEHVERSLADEGIRFVVEQYEPELVERVMAEFINEKRRRWPRGHSR